MTKIRIKKLALENFKCHKSLTLNFEGCNASIYGDNAAGKTSIYDALTWLLFGKDSSGNGEKNIEIKPLDALGNVRDHLAVTSVEAVLLVNGDEISLRRTYKEVWSTKRGSSEATYDGNTSEYYVDGVPCKKNAFQSKVGELVEEDTFRLLTSVSHFANDISWKDRREVLFRVAGVMDDQTILATDARFAPLMEGMGRLGLDDYKKKLQAEKKGFTGVKDQTPARINECEKTIADVEGLDFAKAKAEVDALNARLEGVLAQMMAIRNSNAIQQKQQEVQEVRLELTKLDVENKTFRATQSTGAVNVEPLKAGLSTLERSRSANERQISNEEHTVAAVEQSIVSCRNEWIAVNGEVFTGGTCPTCGQALPADKLAQAVAGFEAQKKTRLDHIMSVADTYKTQKAAAEGRITTLREENATLDKAIQEQKQAISEAEATVVTIEDMPDYAQRCKEFNDRISELTDELNDLQNDSQAALDVLREQKLCIEGEFHQNQTIISKEGLLGYAKKRIEELREDAQNAAAALDAIDQMLFLIDEYSRYKTRFVEDSINGLFRIARFRLFREQANGGVEERCDVVHDGVPYISVNNGMKINLGIDIINTLSTAFGVSVPLFIDNAEAVTCLEPSASQIVRLVVSENDKELRVNYEN